MTSRIARAVTQVPVASSSRLFTTATSVPTSTSDPLLAEIASSSQSSPEHPATSSDPSAPFSWKDFTGPNFPERTPLPRTHGVKVASVIISAHYPYKLDLFSEFAWHSAQSLGIPAAKPAPLKRHRELITVIKAPFVYKKFQENFERRHLHREIVAYDADRSTIDLWLRYLREHDIGGLGIEAKVYEWVQPGFGKKEVGQVEEQLGAGSEVEKEAQRLLAQMTGGKLRLDGSQVASKAKTRKSKSTKVASKSSQSVEAPAESGESVEARSKGETESAAMEDLPKEEK